MGLFDKLKGEFIDIIDWVDNSQDTVMWKFPRYQNEIKMGAKLTVRQSQTALFMNEGQTADVFKPGMHELTTQNMPILTTLKGWKYGFNSPFKADVYFFSTRTISGFWGSMSPDGIEKYCPELDTTISIRANGSYKFKIMDPAKVMDTTAGTEELFTTDEFESILKLKEIINGQLTHIIGNTPDIPAKRLSSKILDFNGLLKEAIKGEFESRGLVLEDISFATISLPDSIKKAMAEKADFEIKGGVNAQKVQTVNAMKQGDAMINASNNQGDVGGMMGMGVGYAMVNQMGQQFNPQNQQQYNQQPNQGAPMPPPVPQASAYFVAVNGAQTGPFTLPVLQQMIQQGTFNRDSLVWKQGMAAWSASAQVPELSALFGAVPPPLPPQ